MVHGRVGEHYEGIWRESDGMNKGRDGREKQGCKGLAQRGGEEIELERIRKT